MSKREIKAHRTEFRGVVYRSQLEARWAAFFTFLRLDFKYEPQCFQLSPSVAYLPDFFLPEYQTWIEIKPADGFQRNEIEKIQGFAQSGKPKTFLVIFGPPDLCTYWLIRGKRLDQSRTPPLFIRAHVERTFVDCSQEPPEWWFREAIRYAYGTKSYIYPDLYGINR